MNAPGGSVLVSDARRHEWLASRALARFGSGARVLLVEDDVEIAEMYRFQLETDGYTVFLATRGSQAISLLSANDPDIVLLDILLPGQSGFEVLQAMRQIDKSERPVVFVSNFGDPQMVDRGLALGAIDYLVKSRTTPADLSRRIADWLHRLGN